jgi:hypothetical protein
VPKGYHPLRYKTEAYDECARSLSTFTKDEREFLEIYRWLREVPEFFSPKDLFCVFNNAEAEKEAEQKLQNFEIDNERIICPDASTLHKLIPYLKRLVRLFPQIKDKEKDQLSLFHKKNTFYRYESQRYLSKIRQRAIHLKTGVVGVREFLASDKQIWQLRMIDGDAWTGIAKIYRALQNMTYTSNSFSEGHYIILKLKRLLAIRRMTNLTALLASMETHNLLMMECGTNQTVNDELRETFRELFNILKQKKSMKIILTTQSEQSTSDFIQQIATETLGEEFITTDEQLIWSDLTDNSKREMLEKKVLFQGRRVALNQLTSAESVKDSIPLSDILQGKELTIGEEPVRSDCAGYNEEYYIDRTFNHYIVIKQEILNDIEEGKFADLLARTEQEFKQLCQQNPNRKVHWLEKGKSGEIVWHQS